MFLAMYGFVGQSNTVYYAEKRKRDVTSWEHQLCVGYLDIKFRTVILNKSPDKSLDYKNNPSSNWNNTLCLTEKVQTSNIRTSIAATD